MLTKREEVKVCEPATSSYPLPSAQQLPEVSQESLNSYLWEWVKMLFPCVLICDILVRIKQEVTQTIEIVFSPQKSVHTFTYRKFPFPKERVKVNSFSIHYILSISNFKSVFYLLSILEPPLTISNIYQYLSLLSTVAYNFFLCSLGFFFFCINCTRHTSFDPLKVACFQDTKNIAYTTTYQ